MKRLNKHCCFCTGCISKHSPYEDGGQLDYDDDMKRIRLPEKINQHYLCKRHYDFFYPKDGSRPGMVKRRNKK